MQRFRTLNRRGKILGCGGVVAGFLTMSCLLIALVSLATTEGESHIAQGESTTSVPTVAEVVSTHTPTIVPPATATLELTSTAAPEAMATAPAISEPTTSHAGIEFVEVRGGSPNDTASVTVRTLPNVECDIGYSTPAGTSSEADGLQSKVADATGVVTWEWEIGPSTNPGDGNITVTCGGDSAFADIEITT